MKFYMILTDLKISNLNVSQNSHFKFQKKTSIYFFILGCGINFKSKIVLFILISDFSAIKNQTAI